MVALPGVLFLPLLGCQFLGRSVPGWLDGHRPDDLPVGFLASMLACALLGRTCLPCPWRWLIVGGCLSHLVGSRCVLGGRSRRRRSPPSGLLRAIAGSDGRGWWLAGGASGWEERGGRSILGCLLLYAIESLPPRRVLRCGLSRIPLSVCIRGGVESLGVRRTLPSWIVLLLEPFSLTPLAGRVAVFPLCAWVWLCGARGAMAAVRVGWPR